MYDKSTSTSTLELQSSTPSSPLVVTNWRATDSQKADEGERASSGDPLGEGGEGRGRTPKLIWDGNGGGEGKNLLI